MFARLKQSISRDDGVSLLLTVLIVSAVLAIALSFSLVSLQEFKISSGARDSFVAIYAADAGIEKLLHTMLNVEGAEHPTSTGPITVNSATYEAETITGGKIKSIGSYRGTKRALEVRYKPPLYAFMAAEKGDFAIVDVTDPTSPIEVGRWTVSDTKFARGIDRVNSRAYLARGPDELLMLDVSDPTQPTPLKRFDAAEGSPSAYANDIAVSGNYGYLAGHDALRVYDISDLTCIEPCLPVATLLTPFADYAYAIELYSPCIHSGTGMCAYLAAGLQGLWIVDISNPLNPFTPAGGVFDPTPGSSYGSYDIATDDSYVYLSASDDGVQKIDVTSLPPTSAGSVITSGLAVDVFEVEGTLYVAIWGGADADILNSADLSLLGSVPDTPSTSPINAFVLRGLLYIAYSGVNPIDLRIYNVLDPSAPVFKGEIMISVGDDGDDPEGQDVVVGSYPEY